MSWKTVCLGSALAVVSAACGAPEPAVIAESTHRYVVSALDIPDVTAEGVAVGFNLDAYTDDPRTPAREDVDDGTGPECTDEQDFVSPITGEEGVDNQLSAYVIGLIAGMLGSGGVAGAMLEQIAAGRFLLVLDVTSNGLVDDETVSVHLFLAAPPGPACDNATMVCPAGSACPGAATVAGPGMCGPTTGAAVAPATTGRVVPGQAFVETTSLATVDATITDGRLEFAAPLIPVPLVIDTSLIVLPLREARVAGDLSPDGTSLTNGEIGARMQGSDLKALSEVGGCPGFDSCMESWRIAHPDLDMDASMVCQAVSAGLSFDAVHAE